MRGGTDPSTAVAGSMINRFSITAYLNAAASRGKKPRHKTLEKGSICAYETATSFSVVRTGFQLVEPGLANATATGRAFTRLMEVTHIKLASGSIKLGGLAGIGHRNLKFLFNSAAATATPNKTHALVRSYLPIASWRSGR